MYTDRMLVVHRLMVDSAIPNWNRHNPFYTILERHKHTLILSIDGGVMLNIVDEKTIRTQQLLTELYPKPFVLRGSMVVG